MTIAVSTGLLTKNVARQLSSTCAPISNPLKLTASTWWEAASTLTLEDLEELAAAPVAPTHEAVRVRYVENLLFLSQRRNTR